MQRLLPWVGALALASPAVAQADDIVVEMAPCKVTREVPRFYVRSSKRLVWKGSVDVDGASYDIYLPRDHKNAYSRDPRPKRRSMLTTLTSTYLSVDQDRDGKIAVHESYFSELPLRIGDAMFDVVAIAKDGSSLTLRPADHALACGVVGRKAAAFEWRDTEGRVVQRDDFAGKVLVIDVWAPS